MGKGRGEKKVPIDGREGDKWNILVDVKSGSG